MAPVPTNGRCAEWSQHRSALDRALRPSGSGFSAHHVLDVLRERLPADGILAYDVGAHTHQIATQWRTDLPNTLLATNGWSSMGYGMPAAYAAKLGLSRALGRLRCRRRRLPDDGGRAGAGAAAQSRGADDRAQRRLARPDESETGAQKLSALRRAPRRAAGIAAALFRRALPRRERLRGVSRTRSIGHRL